MNQTATKEQLINEAQAAIARLVPVKHRLPDNACEFVLDLDSKLKAYGTGTYLSERQMRWLRALDVQYADDPRQMSLLLS